MDAGAVEGRPQAVLVVLQRFEEHRRRITRRLRTVLLIGLGVAALAALLAFLGHLPLPARELWPMAAAAAGVLTVLAVVVTWSIVVSPYQRAWKREAVPALVQLVAPMLRYHPERGIARDAFVRCQLFTRSPDRYRTEDLLAGKVDATEIEAAEVHAEYRTRGSKGQTRWHTLFKGLLFVGDFHKHFHGHTVVLPDRTERFLGRFAQMLQGLDFTRPGELVKLEDPEFERRFCVFSDDQIEARYILSPSFMRRLLALAGRHAGALSVAFHDSRVFVAIPRSRNMFEAPLFRSVVASETVREYCEDLRETVGLVEELNLNTRIWSKH